MNGALVLIRWILLVACWTPPEYWDAEDVALEMSLSNPIFGLMVAERISLLLVVLRLLVLVCICLLLSFLLRVQFGER